MTETNEPTTDDEREQMIEDLADYVHAEPLPAEHELDDAECHNCGEDWNGGEDWNERHLHGGPAAGEDWKYQCPGCEHETFEVGI